MTLKVVEPINITEAALTASDIPEPDAASGEVEWIPDRFSGFLFTNKTYQDQGFVHAVKVGGVLYALETKEVNIGSNGVIHKYDNNGNHAGSFSVDGAIKSFGVSEDLNRLVGVDPANGTVIEYNLSTESFIRSISIAGDVSTPRGITYGDGSYFVLDSTEQKIARFDSNFTFQSRDTVLDDATDSIWSLQFLTGGFCSYVNSLTGELKAARIGSSDIKWRIPTSEAAGSNFSIFGHYYSGGNPLVLNYTEDTAYLYVDGIYDGLYKPSDRVIKSSTHKLYQCLIATGQDPEEGATGDAAATWIVAGPTNKWAMFDDQNSTITKSSGLFSVELESSDYIMAYGVTGSSGLTSVRCQVYDSGNNLIYDDTQSAFDNVGAPGDFIYASEDVFYKKKLYQTDIPPTENFKAVFTFNGSDIEIGNLTIGPAIELGPCLTDSKNESLDLSEQKFDDFGNETYTERPIITFATYETISSIESSNIINRFLNVIRRKGCLWIGEVGYNQSIVTFGRIERDPIPYTMPTEIRYTIRVRGFA